ncbi:hypothetical protein C8J56DRAFT_783451, partial [Mycena floridula]
DDETMDHEWIVRNISGGMSAGFGSRGESPPLAETIELTKEPKSNSHSFFIAIIILAGWAAKTGVAGLVGR